MFLLKELIVVFAVIILASFGLLELSNSNSDISSRTHSEISSDKNNLTSISKNEFSDDFLYYRNLIQNEIIDKAKIQVEIKNLKSEFEQKYLSALLKKCSDCLGDQVGSGGFR